MQLDSDVVLLGTGVAPLVAASRLASNQKKVCVLNPDWDFFREDSELPFDPVWDHHSSRKISERVKENTVENVLSVLRPDFPGPVEFIKKDAGPGEAGYFDIEAPHVRSRHRLTVRSPRSLTQESHRRVWEGWEEDYLQLGENGFQVEVLEGIRAKNAFPGYFSSDRREIEEGIETRAIRFPPLADVDAHRYRIGLLEYIQDRLSEEQFYRTASQIELTDQGVRFLDNGKRVHLRAKEGVLVFWTPRLTNWISSHLEFDLPDDQKKTSVPREIQVWELWSLISRDAVHPDMIGVYGDLFVWADFEGPSTEEKKNHLLSVLRPGGRYPLKKIFDSELGESWASESSFSDLSELCQGFLRWDKFSVRSMNTRALMDWSNVRSLSIPIKHHHHMSFVVNFADGPLPSIVRAAREVASRYL